ncbi:dihydroorotase [Denitrobaculum tricleocarpae]|uniref:Dihydroorotase n=1 Tax=Denitrobaculum tricleocarpae TaxID=2591009 RepID=A0A545TTJ9_9PROT|nr:dihydroorotase [Denitrobaculum tricleocarpae]TQV80538.1 dihydroorotase [Denitrobaculum tricleocarpae]
MTSDSLTLREPDDWHVHLRDDDMLAFAADYTARQFARAIVMPNLVPPVTTAAAADAYRTRILSALPEGRRFTPLMTAYLTDEIDPAEIATGFQDGVFTACKLYPAGATTNSAAGVTNVRKIWPVLERMQAIGMPLLVHGEVVAADIDIFDREAVFLETVLTPLLADFPSLKVVLEHITTEDSVRFVEAAGANLAATITAHHLRIDRNAMFQGGIRPHAYCLPVAKRRRHKEALRKAATSGQPRFFLGTDSAPHQKHDKESACGCAGIFSAPMALESYAQTFEEEGALERLEAFASEFGPRFYGLPLNEGSVTLRREAQDLPELMGDGNVSVVPFHAGETLAWRFTGRSSQAKASPGSA